MAAHRRSTTFSAALFLLHLLVASASSSSPPPPREQDRSALLQLKNALSSGSGELPGRWSPEPSGSHCSWTGVRCDVRRRVVSVSLPPGLGRRSSGKLPPAAGRLTELKVLSLPFHGLHGDIPGDVWRLQHLEVLNLASNSLRGSLPAAFPEGLRSLDLSGNQLSGRIPPALGSCEGLRSLRLSSNSFDGSIPRRIGKLAALRVLELSGNKLAGAVPPELLHCRSLVKVDLSRNLLHGQVPSSLKELKKLRFLSLAGNNFSGEIPPGLGQLRSPKILNLSSNCLSGVVPIDLVALRNHTVLLLDNNVLSGEIQVPATAPPVSSTVRKNNISSVTGDSSGAIQSPQPSGLFAVSTQLARTRVLTEEDQGAPPDGSSNRMRIVEIASVTSASVIILVLLVVVILYVCTRKWAPRMSRRSLISRQVKVFEGVDVEVPITYEAVIRATGNFSASNCIGTGGFGSTYRAEIAPGVLVAIKRLAVGKQHGDKQFKAEVEALGPQCRHPNLVTLIGFHIGDQETFLIYNYLAGGNLERFIQERTRRQIRWRTLHKIALDIACALAYMHDECVPRILHRDVKPSNVLLDSEYSAYLSDFGLARLLWNSETHATTGVAGTFGYVAPEYAMTCRVSEKADVYSYGVMLFELISDKKALDPSFSPYGNGFGIVNWASVLIKKGRVHEFFIDGLWDEAPHDDLAEMLDLGVKCTRQSPASRPTMKHVVCRLRELRPPY